MLGSDIMKCEICEKKIATIEVRQEDPYEPSMEVCNDCVTDDMMTYAWSLEDGGRL